MLRRLVAAARAIDRVHLGLLEESGFGGCSHDAVSLRYLNLLLLLLGSLLLLLKHLIGSRRRCHNLNLRHLLLLMLLLLLRDLVMLLVR